MLAAFGPKIFQDHAYIFARSAPATMEIPVTTLLLDRRIAFAGLAGEPFVELQEEWRAQCPVHDSFFLGYTNGFFDYIPTIPAAQGGYGAGDSNTYVAPGTGERMLQLAVIRVYGMPGQSHELPKDVTNH
jgi:hypothetical protein